MVEWNRENLWRQGHILSAEAAIALGLAHRAGQDSTLVVVATHDCDLAQPPVAEPLIELIVGQTILSQDGNFTHAKTPRKLHIEFTGSAACAAEFEATSKVSIVKLALAGFLPRSDARLSPESQSIFQFWLASRYKRSAFPDEFERRIKNEKLAEKIVKAIKPHGQLIAGIFFDVDDGVEVVRNGPDDPYTLDIYILHPSDSDFDAAEAAAQQAAVAIEKAFADRLFNPTNTWKYIELRSCEVVSESVLTYQQFKQLRRWRLEYISLADNPQQPILAE